MSALRRAWVPTFPRASFREGARAMSPLVVAIGVWGVVTGVAMVEKGMPIPTAIALSLTVFAGSAQLATLPLLAVGTPLPVVLVTALLVNMRFVIFSAAARRYFADLPWRHKLLAGYLNGDLGFALFSRRFADDPAHGTPEQYGYFYGTATVNWAAWHVASIAGILLAGLAPTSWGLDLAASLALLAVLIPMADRAPAVAGVVVTGVLAVVTVGMPMKLGLLVSVIAGVGVAVAAEAVRGRRGAPVARATEPAR